MRALVRVGSDAAVQALGVVLGSATPGLPASALHGLGSTGSARAVEPLRRALEQALEARDAARAKEVIRTLGRLGRPEAGTALASVLERRARIGGGWLRELKSAAVRGPRRHPRRRGGRGARAGGADEGRAAPPCGADGARPARARPYLPPGQLSSVAVLGIDLGSKRIGLAISDPSERIALPAGMIESRGRKHDLAAIRSLVGGARREPDRGRPAAAHGRARGAGGAQAARAFAGGARPASWACRWRRSTSAGPPSRPSARCARPAAAGASARAGDRGRRSPRRCCCAPTSSVAPAPAGASRETRGRGARARRRSSLALGALGTGRAPRCCRLRRQAGDRGDLSRCPAARRLGRSSRRSSKRPGVIQRPRRRAARVACAGTAGAAPRRRVRALARTLAARRGAGADSPRAR